MATKGIQIKDTDKGFKRIQNELAKAKGAYVKVGVLSAAGQYEDGKPANLSDVATWNEFGTTQIPSRPFMRRSFDKNKNVLEEFLKKEKGNVLSGDKTVKQALNTVGLFFTAKVKEIFVQNEFQPNAPYTIFLKNRKNVHAAEKTVSAARKAKGEISEKRFQNILKAKHIIANKGIATPLIDTGRLRQSIQHEVVLGTKGKNK